MSSDPKSINRGGQLFGAFVRSNEPPKPAAPPPDDGAKAPEPRPAPVPRMWCSECRAPIGDRYFALNERPICAKCRPQFVARIERGTGSAALIRAALHGFVTALAAAAGLGVFLLYIPFFRVFVVIGVGYVIGKRIMAAVGGYGGRRYQLLAAALTYLAVGLGSLVPVAKGVSNAVSSARTAQPAQSVDSSSTLASQDQSADEEPEATNAEGPAATNEEVSAAETSVTKPPSTTKAKALGVGALLVLFLTVPIMAMFTYGLYAGVIGMFSLGFAIVKAWQLTDGQGLDLQLKGPFRVGTGPIEPFV